jgi:tetratricopeptide (TPR) repeat protein
MSDLSNRSLEQLQRGDIKAAGEIAYEAITRFPSDWHGYYALGQAFRYSNRFVEACGALEAAFELEPRDTSLLLALAIARQLSGQLASSIEALRVCLEIDPDYALAYNTLGMTQKLKGEYDKSIHNYDAGAKALARCILREMTNSRSSRRYPLQRSRSDLWADYAIYAALYSVARDSIEELSFPTGEMAEEDNRIQRFEGWFWIDTHDASGKSNRVICPNFNSYFSVRLRADSLYANLMGNRSTVLRLVGQEEEAQRHLEEAQDFS